MSLAKAALKILSIFICLGSISVPALSSPPEKTTQPASAQSAPAGLKLSIAGKADAARIEPLDQITISGVQCASASVCDSKGRVYARVKGGEEMTFLAAGAAGRHKIILEDSAGNPTGEAEFALVPATKVADDGGKFENLLSIAKNTLRPRGGGVSTVNFKGKNYKYFVSWLRDHVHTSKGMKYFYDDVTSFFDLNRLVQREDGMFWDYIGGRPGRDECFQETAFGKSGYAKRIESYIWTRMPVEADVEYLFVEGVYFAWKATGDTEWMKSNLDAAIKGMEYSRTDPARWSDKFKLIKRGYTIDTWDFQVNDEFTLKVPLWSTLLIDPVNTKFGIMFGDNTGYAMSCRRLAEMLKAAGRDEQAAKYLELEAAIRKALDETSWNGKFFRHFVPEDASIKRNLGVDEASQISLSNTYSINRGITHEQAAAIINTYQDLKNHLPKGSPGEWYAIYPIFQNGFGGHTSYWEYMNGGVSPIFAGELAHGAFENGFEDYAADILKRIRDLAKKNGDWIHFMYRGADIPPADKAFRTIDLSAQANMDFAAKGADGVPGWMLTIKGDDFAEFPSGKQTFAEVPFAITDPVANGRKACAAVSSESGISDRIDIPISDKAASIYFLHAAGQVGPSGVAGAVRLNYEDETRYTEYIIQGRNISGWWYPNQAGGSTRMAWRGKNELCKNIGLVVWGMNNPHPEKKIKSVSLLAALDKSIYAVLGMTLSGAPVYFTPQSMISYGGPDNWAAGAIVYALIEGLAGVVDAGLSFDKTVVSPRWQSAGIKKAGVCVNYPASGGYVAYNYQHDATARTINLTLTGSGQSAAMKVLLPAGAKAKSVRIDNKDVEFKTASVEKSAYASFDTPLPGPAGITISYETAGD